MMKVSIWQQFSSNHSGGFTVIGNFKSKENLGNATKELRTLIETARDSRNGDDVTGYEYAIGLEYGFEWTEHLYWANNANQVVQFDN